MYPNDEPQSAKYSDAGLDGQGYTGRPLCINVIALADFCAKVDCTGWQHCLAPACCFLVFFQMYDTSEQH